MLDKFMENPSDDPPQDTPTLTDEEVKYLIRKRRGQMLIHSCIYYELNDNIISDHKWQEWADELQKLQEDYPHLKRIKFYDRAFVDWTGATGNHLPHKDPWVLSKSKAILKYHKEKYGE